MKALCSIELKHRLIQRQPEYERQLSEGKDARDQSS